MSSFLLELKPKIIKARNLTYFGNYLESILQFKKILNCLQIQIRKITDRILLNEWNKLISEIKYEKLMSENMVHILAGNLQEVNPARNPNIPEDFMIVNRGAKVALQKQLDSDQPYQNNQNILRLQKNIEQKKERQRKEKIQRQKQYEAKQKQIWPQKPPTAPKNFNRSYSQFKNPSKNKPISTNKSLCKNDNKRNNKNSLDKKQKSYLKSGLTQQNGPDAALISMLQREVVQLNLNISFDEIADLQNAKDLLYQAIILPLHLPQVFKGVRRPWKGVLLFGPPGTGKTLLAKAIASTGKTTFFNVTASSLASKWKGQSQKLVRILFQMAEYYAPTTIFIDEIDSLASRRGQREEESSRKLKTQFMARIDGASSGLTNKNIVVIGATNRPWDLDDAIIRRFQKRVYIPLPTLSGRNQLLKIALKNENIQQLDLNEIAQKIQGYSGADITNLCRQAAYIPMRKKLKNLKKQGKLMNKIKDNDQQWIKQFQKQVNVPITMKDFKQALRNVKPSVGKNLQQFTNWETQFGEKGNIQDSNYQEKQIKIQIQA